MHTVSNALIEQLSIPMPAATDPSFLTSATRYLRPLLLCPSPASQVQSSLQKQVNIKDVPIAKPPSAFQPGPGSAPFVSVACIAPVTSH